MKQAAQVQHIKLLELISTISESNTTTGSLSDCLGAKELQNSLFKLEKDQKFHVKSLISNSFSLLPLRPKIFHGRETELEDIMETLSQDAPRIAILGGGGMGKTSLARAALHHPDTCTRSEQRFFVSAEPATPSVELAALIGLHIGSTPGKDLTKAVVHYFTNIKSYLLILDNLETVWEPIESRGGAEEFPSLLAEVPHLGLIITDHDVRSRAASKNHAAQQNPLSHSCKGTA
ncbi:hypothetical protein C8R45DRAFT_1084166 [Mycena sanguinolenta]|nr:hypothetical protein C8R45DRAFT_1084166 [Mycena sanguinolenta]